MSAGLGILLVCAVFIALGGLAGVFVGLVLVALRNASRPRPGQDPDTWTDDDEIAARYHH